jgi:hypothetical protein
MIVLITNVTDGPKQKPREVRVYNKRLSPGAQIRVDARFVDAKVRSLAEAGFVVIGPVPPWYADYAAQRQKRNLSAEQVKQKLQAKKDYAAKKAAAKAASSKSPKPSPALKPEPVPSFDLSDSVEEPKDEVSSDTKESKKKKRRR